MVAPEIFPGCHHKENLCFQEPKPKLFSDLKSDWKRMLLLNDCYIAVYGHFFALCMLFFHKPEVETVILICSMGLNLNWHKSYCLKCSLRLRTTLAKSQKIATDKWPFYDNFWPFFHHLYAHLSQN